ncbi:MAG: flavodoxin domain-containing protein [Pseudobacter sp.]|uniref:flavodoxin domain-containing protein n=1 Tax=Pseudobacter sp. TaxID=2045420 RepID=UPI003F7DADA8
MQNAIIIYKGRYGATRQYAEWLGEALQIPVAGPREINEEKVRRCDLLILGSSVYIGKLELSGWIKKHASILADKKLILFIVCATPPDETGKLREIEKNNVPASIRTGCRVFFLHGKMNMQELSWKDRVLLKLGAQFVKDPEEKKHMLETFNDVRKENMQALTEACAAALHTSGTDKPKQSLS